MVYKHVYDFFEYLRADVIRGKVEKRNYQSWAQKHFTGC